MEEMLVKARFQEAKLRDLAGISSKVVAKTLDVPTDQQTGATPTQGASPNSSGSQSRGRPNLQCFHCQGTCTGHFVKRCSLKGQAAPRESRGRNHAITSLEHRPRKVAAIAATGGEPTG
jgi:hypothetical protein